MSKRVAGAPVEFAAWAGFFGRAAGSLKYLRASPCFCGPDFHFYCYYLFYQAEIHEKEEAEGREWSTSFLPLARAASYLSFQESVSSFASLKTWQVGIALGINFFFFTPSVSADFIRNYWSVVCEGTLCSETKPRDHPYRLSVTEVGVPSLP